MPANMLPRSLAGDASPDGLLAPSAAYLTGEDKLRLTSFGNLGSLVLTLRGRVLKPDYRIEATEVPHVPNANRTVASTTLALSEGWPLGFRVAVSTGSPSFGAVWVLLELVRGDGSAAVVVETLGYGFVTANQPFTWPGGVNYLATDGPGNLRSIAGTQPGAGAEISETVPAAAQWELLAFEADLVASGSAGNRIPQLTIDDGTTVYSRFSINQNQIASQTWRYSFQQATPLNADTTRFIVSAPLPAGIKLGPGHRIRTVTNGILAGDQWSAPQYLVKERFDV